MVYVNELTELTRLKPRIRMKVMQAMLFRRFGSSLSRLVPAWKARATVRGHAHQLS